MRRLLACLLFVLPPCVADAAGPEDTARMLEHADGLVARPLTERIHAYRRVLTARRRLDKSGFRALRKLASLYGKQGDPQAQAALAAWSAVRLPRNGRETFLARVRLGRGLRDEGDLGAAETVFRDVVAHGGRMATWSVAKSLAYLSEDALDRGDGETVRWAARTGDAERIDAVTQMKLLGAWGLVALQAGERAKAVRLQLRCWKLFDATQRADAKLARRGARAWLDLPLRRALKAE